MEWHEKHLPVQLGNRTNDTHLEQVTIDSIDLDLMTTRNEEVPDNILWEKFVCLEDPSLPIRNIGGRWIKHKEKYNEERVGLYISSIAQGFCKSGLFEHTWWDVPYDIKLVSKELSVCDFVKLNSAVHLPFISLLPSTKDVATAIAFHYDDFLPNPRKRRRLLNLIKQKDKSVLEAYFSKQKMLQYVWGPSTSSAVSPSWSQMKRWERQWLRLQAVTAHQPNSVLGEILIEGNEEVLEFTLQYFHISAEIVNKLKIGIYYAVERLARIGRLSLLKRLVGGRFELSGKVHFRAGSFERIWSAIFAAIEADKVEYLKAAIAVGQGKQLHVRGYQGITALGLAVMKNKAELVKVLLVARARVDEPSWGDETALCLALQMGVSRGVIQELIQAGASVNGSDLTGNSIRDQLKEKGIVL